LASYPVLREPAVVPQPLWQTVELCERAAAVALFAAISPFLAFAALVIWAASRQSPLIAHRRVGWRGETLWMLKLRTMWPPSKSDSSKFRWVQYIDDDSGPASKRLDDPRVSHWFARFCRRHSLDELPQLWHVIRGEMSLVGPRPVTAREIRQYYGEDAEEILSIKPGLAGLWQTSGRNRLTYAERKRLDLRYVRDRDLRMYFRILLRTVPEVWSGANSW